MNPLIEQKVKEIQGVCFVDTKLERLIRQALLSLYNQGQIDALGEVESTMIEWERNDSELILVKDILSHIASLKEKAHAQI